MNGVIWKQFMQLTCFNQYSEQINLEQEQFSSCLSTAKYVKEIQNDLNDGRTYGITGTPGFFYRKSRNRICRVEGSSTI